MHTYNALFILGVEYQGKFQGNLPEGTGYRLDGIHLGNYSRLESNGQWAIGLDCTSTTSYQNKHKFEDVSEQWSFDTSRVNEWIVSINTTNL